LAGTAPTEIITRMSGRPFDELAAARLGVRRRDLFLVAWLQTMSSGLLARSLGCAGWVMLPLSLDPRASSSPGAMTGKEVVMT
jgi:hypothetical protein